MNRYLSKFRSGDTLIEVIFAFAILGSIIGFSYTGVIQGRKSALAARQRTQALLIAQYQARALGAYRASLPWDSAGGSPNVLDGGSTNAALAISQPPPQTTSYFCLREVGQVSPPPPLPQLPSQWQMVAVSSTDNCDNGLADELPEPNTGDSNKNIKVRIFFKGFASPAAVGISDCFVKSDCPLIRGEVGVYWTDPFGNQSNVKDFVMLSRSQ